MRGTLEYNLAKWTRRKDEATRQVDQLVEMIEKRNAIEAEKSDKKKKTHEVNSFKKQNPIFFKCATCGMCSPRGRTKTEAWIAAVAKGWTMAAGMAKYCAKHRINDN